MVAVEPEPYVAPAARAPPHGRLPDLRRQAGDARGRVRHGRRHRPRARACRTRARSLVAYSLTLLLVQVGGLGLTSANPYFAAREPSRDAADRRQLALARSRLGHPPGRRRMPRSSWSRPVRSRGSAGRRSRSRSRVSPAPSPRYFLQSVLLGEGRMVAYNAVEAGQTALTLVASSRLRALRLRDHGTLLVLSASRYVAAPSTSCSCCAARAGSRRSTRPGSHDVRVRVPRLRRDRPLVPRSCASTCCS